MGLMDFTLQVVIGLASSLGIRVNFLRKPRER
ncbi:hypothetical protein Mrose_01422 [Calidithermus roseus]|uniref:Uncharacterized protein n=1 Tax=Calidithermus roseus TaxID=1644118 RepID=A0A399ET52_9DEIN|nr:hypothetical protein Mrose_01422 [Calidithermus roseus]